ncbi:hypothetical protein [Tsukamurella spumae]|uniref:Uncharacterized protein n=1 Tax=Tsukamurella spumae TaxID=44753 RepID=A0A846X0J7_9ACTN|nr:hypothetical protein [Tsukamurella spumae]NKY19067.1 hypothetical protein [Tsukamurella spumae]
MGKIERRKDAAQEAVESTAIRVGRIATIITTAVADVAREIGDAVSDALEMRQAAKAAAADEARQAGRTRQAGEAPQADEARPAPTGRPEAERPETGPQEPDRPSSTSTP